MLCQIVCNIVEILLIADSLLTLVIKYLGYLPVFAFNTLKKLPPSILSMSVSL